MPLKVKAGVQYLTAAVEKMREQDYATQQIIKAVKGKNPGGKSRYVTMGQKRYHLAQIIQMGLLSFLLIGQQG